MSFTRFAQQLMIPVALTAAIIPNFASAQVGPATYQDCLTSCYQGAEMSGYERNYFMNRCGQTCTARFEGGGGGSGGAGPNNLYEWWWNTCALGDCDPGKFNDGADKY